MPTKDELIKKAEKPGKDAMKLHPFYRGKVQTTLKCCVRDFNDFAIWYTPGVAKPCMDIHNNPETVFEHTNKGNTIAVISDGTRVLGLGDIGPEAAMPVMEGKALLFKYLGGVDAVPICLNTKDPEKIIESVLLLQPSFGGVNLEDFAQPKCFHILDTLREKAEIPIWHDDQQGTAAVTVAGLINALKIIGKSMDEVKVSMIGAGAANIAIARVMITAGITPENIVLCDSKGALHKDRADRENLQKNFKEKWHFCQTTNKAGITGGLDDVIKGTDVLISLSKPGPDTVKPEWIKTMNSDAVVFLCANPIPECWPWDAKEAGARIVATGRSDFPNQVNNSLGFPGIFRGTLDVFAKTITDEMCIAAAEELAKCAEDKGMHEEYLIPTMDEWEVYPRVAVAVALKAIEQGVHRRKFSKDELFKMAEFKIKEARDQLKVFQDAGIIKLPVED
ncbi:MAG: NAD(P)-dependent malic enzyme [Planctomycetota bacterium]|jgi:malate dehydrogenase (oxaloacetate-decarboxylating)